jgi:hypothetical protein
MPSLGDPGTACRGSRIDAGFRGSMPGKPHPERFPGQAINSGRRFLDQDDASRR